MRVLIVSGPPKAVGDDCGQSVAALELSSDRDGDDHSKGTLLLADIREIVKRELGGSLTSEAFVNRLAKMEDRPWAEWGKPPKPISKNQLARLLRPFDIQPGDIWVNGTCLRGYRRSQFEDSFARYLPHRGK